MSHMLEVHGDLAAFVSYRETPWHMLGTTVEEELDTTSALEIAHLSGWDVRKSPLTTTVNGLEIPVPDKFAVVRDNPFVPGQVDVLGTVGKQYAVTQNEEHAEFLDALTAQGAKIETAGSLKGGREVFVTMKAPAHMLVGGKDRLDLYVSALNTHDGSKSFRVITTPVRTVCWNTQVAALGARERMFSKRHTAGNGGAVQRAREALDLTFKYSEDFEAEAEKMIQKTLTNNEFFKITKNLFPVVDSASELVQERQQDRQNDLMTLFKESPTNTEIRGTNWAGYQAVTEYMDFFTNIPGKDGAGARKARADKVFSGEYDGWKEAAFKLLQVA